MLRGSQRDSRYRRARRLAGFGGKREHGMDLRSGRQVAEGGAPVIHGSTLGLDSGSMIKDEEMPKLLVPSDIHIPPNFYGDPAKDEHSAIGAYLWQFEAIARRNAWNEEAKPLTFFPACAGRHSV